MWAVVMTQMYSRKSQFKIGTNQVLGKNVLFDSLPTLTTSIYRGGKKHIQVTWTRTTNKWTWKFIWRFTFILLQVARIEKASTFLWLCVCGKYRNCIWIEWMTFTATYNICKHEHQLYARVIVNPVYGDIFVEQLSVTRRKEVQLPSSAFPINLINVIRNLLWK